MGHFDPARDGDSQASLGSLLTSATERMVEAAVQLGEAAVPAALLREIRHHGLAQSATIWRRSSTGWTQQRSLGAPTPNPQDAAAPGWRAAGAETFSLGLRRALVIQFAPDTASEAREELLDLVDGLAALAGSLMSDLGASAALDGADIVPPALPGLLPDPPDEGEDRDAAA